MPEKLNRVEEVELRWKELQIEQMEDQMNTRRELKARLAADRQRQYEDFRKSEAIKAHRQRICKHRKGGRDNKFWNGNSQDYSINQNTYPTGEVVIFCTRCNKEVRKPDRELKKTDPKAYATQWDEWKLWLSYPTDNTPSGTKIFEVFENAAA